MPSKVLSSGNKDEYLEGTYSSGTGGLCVLKNPENGMFSVIQLKGEDDHLRLPEAGNRKQLRSGLSKSHELTRQM